MKIAKIVGNIVSVAKMDSFIPAKLYILQILDMHLKPLDKYIVAVDTVGTAINDIVLYNTGSGARMTDLTRKMPTDASIVARLDENSIKDLMSDNNATG